MLFENMTPVVSAIIARQVEDVINNFEPEQDLYLFVHYQILIECMNTSFILCRETPTELVDLTIMLERLR